MLKTKYILVAAVLLQANLVISQDSSSQLYMADDQPSSAYTIYNGKVYMHPKKEDGFFASLFKFDLYKNPVVQTVLGWTDLWYGAPANNETEVLPPEPLATQASFNRPQYAPVPYNQQYGYGKQAQNNPGFHGKQSSYYGEHHPNSPQHPGQSYDQKQPQYGNPQQLYPQMNNYGQPPASSPVPPYLNPAHFQFYGNPNVDIVTSLESQGHMDNLLTSEDRNFKAGVTKDPLEGASKPGEFSEATKRQGSLQSEVSSGKGKKVAEAKADDAAAEDHYPCPPIGQWKWNGEYCIAVGPYPTWACKPTDMIMTGRVAVCRNKIFFPNEP
ncbi:unnamed protein product [Allacma fusca]|uniref:Uncharacterized protein n=1 Tax=Allacma fusca TaxID=39272 RepID=A0A8J2J7E8_9HEXA|nr:unnamed protein product [Allacma fusca]